MKRKLFFGGTFDPIHHGHLGLLNIVKDKLTIDDVYLLPTKQPPWKSEMAPINHRLAMINLALPDNSFHIDDFELNCEGVSYTIDTIKHFHSLFQGDELYYLIGSDQANLFHEWKDSDKIADLTHIVVYARPGYPLSRTNVDRYHMLVVEGKRFDISSTEIRLLHNLDLPWSVIDYILNHDLYFTEKLKTYYDDKRFLHVISVAKLAYEIASRNQLDKGKAVSAALLHDIAKKLDHEDGKKMILAFDASKASAPPFSVHQFAGAILANRDFGINDEAILDAIRYHASGKPNMGPIGEILYAADKIEPLRGFDSASLIKACYQDYHQGFIEVLKANYEYHKANAKPFKYDLTADTMAYYLGGNE